MTLRGGRRKEMGQGFQVNGISRHVAQINQSGRNTYTQNRKTNINTLIHTHKYIHTHIHM